MDSKRFVVGGRKLILGMVHLQPLPGTPYYAGDLDFALKTAVESAVALENGGADGCLIQTVDRVYGVEDESDPARISAMTLFVRAITEVTAPGFQVGVQIMRNSISASMAVAKVAGGTFVRAGALVGAALTPQGIVTGNPLAVAQYRAQISAWDIGLVADVHSAHFRWFGEEKEVGDVARAARQAGADAVAVGHQDVERALSLIASVRESDPRLPVIIAGHTDHHNAGRLLAAADGAFVGTCLERGGWGGQIDVDRVRSYIDVVRRLE
jgi:membrane complex biogenesis BtpA family protein